MSPEEKLSQLGRVVTSEPFEYATSWPIEAISLIRPDGEEMSLLLKRYQATAPRTGPGAVLDPRREAIVYELLASRGLDAPQFLGAGEDWLMIERLRGTPLWQLGELEPWLAAARMAAALHSEYQAAPPPPQRLLVRDGRLWALWFDRALAHGAPLDDVRPAFDHARRRLSALPATLIHGEMYPFNLIVDGERVVAVDWEMAGIGPGVIDLAALLTGWPAETQSEIAAAYGPVDPADLAAAQLMLALQWLGWHASWEPPAEHRHDWLAEARTTAEMLALVGNR